MTEPAIQTDSMPAVESGHNDIVADLRSAMEPEPAGGASELAPTPEPGADPSPSPEPVAEPPASTQPEPSAGPVRDGKGRFTKAGGDPAEPAATDPAAPEDPAAATEPAAAAADPADPVLGPLEPPPHWPLDQQKLFREQPEAVQKWMTERDRETAKAFTEKTEAVAEQRRRYEGLDQVIGPREQAIKMQGMSVPQYVDHLLALSDYANNDPGAFISWFAKERGFDLGTLTGAMPAPGADPTVVHGADPATALDPEVSQVLASHVAPIVAPLLEQVKTLQGQIQGMTAADTQARATSGQQTVEQFQAATDESGVSKHPYFAEVRAVMADLMEKGHAADMESAYDMAVYANPVTRSKLEAAREAAAARKRQNEAAAKAVAAQRAGSSVTGTPAGHGERQPADSVLDEVRQVWNGHA